ncbi:hypothetical protein E4S40_04930 [Algoriphagus kandeliae]|uniref:DoxX family protein n=1 Tax=Algoriphagus kandeliae TaxID=2562278 RepID=A0A4Y9QX81_9BACT|nr:hypothetical protein [Algoriphagus kandeliae]TFV95565.1 hypothetical protein E4S40_04930 [Algoriphagus kandeliae]
MDQKAQFPIFPMHFRGLLLLAGMYTVAWSAFFKWFGPELVAWLAISPGQSFDVPAEWYGNLGIVVGLVLFVSAFYPVSWVYMILAGITGKVILAIWFSLGFLPEIGWNKRTGFHLIVNELLWLIPLILIFLRGLQVKEYLRKQEE